MLRIFKIYFFYLYLEKLLNENFLCNVIVVIFGFFYFRCIWFGKSLSSGEFLRKSKFGFNGVLR